MSFGLYVGLSCIVAVAALVQGTIGVGFALIVAPALSFLAPDLLPVTVLVLMIPLNVYVMLRERGSLDVSGAGWVTAGRLVGTFGGLAVLALLTGGELRVVVGVATVAAVLATLMAPAFEPSRPAYVAAGLVTGVTETATGVGGPPLALVFQHVPGPVLRTTIAACFLVGEAFSLLVLAMLGRIATAQLFVALMLLPPLAIGAGLSRLLHRRINGPALRSVLLVFALISGILLLL